MNNNFLAHIKTLTLSLVCSLVMSTNAYATESHLHKALWAPELRKKSAQFVDNVLQVMPSTKFFALVDSIKEHKSLTTDAQIYAQLLEKSTRAQSRFAFYHQFKALQKQKALLGSQAEKLLAERKVINGCLEIGTPGTYMDSLRKRVTLTGTTYSMLDKQRLSDKAHGFRAYKQFVPLNDHAPIAENAIASNSLDLVICFVGLHHIPAEKLNSFISSIARVLRPGGIFLLRDHDAKTEELQTIAYAAHSIYNALIPGESVQAEEAEYRNFKSLSAWIELVEAQGFTVAPERILQEGDPIALSFK